MKYLMVVLLVVLVGSVSGSFSLAMSGTETERERVLLLPASMIVMQGSSNGCGRRQLFMSHTSRLCLSDIDDTTSLLCTILLTY